MRNACTDGLGGFDWDREWGTNGEIAIELVKRYRWETMYEKFKAIFNRDVNLSGTQAWILLVHWGDVPHALEAWEKCCAAWAKLTDEVRCGSRSWTKLFAEVFDTRGTRAFALVRHIAPQARARASLGFRRGVRVMRRRRAGTSRRRRSSS